jgi:hypothetical protein
MIHKERLWWIDPVPEMIKRDGLRWFWWLWLGWSAWVPYKSVYITANLVCLRFFWTALGLWILHTNHISLGLFTRANVHYIKTLSARGEHYNTFSQRLYILKHTSLHCNVLKVQYSVADPGFLSRIPDTNISIPGIKGKRHWIPDPESATKNLSIFSPTNGY